MNKEQNFRIGPSGNSLSFYAAGYKNTFQAPKYLANFGLNAYEYSFGRGINMTDEMAAKIRISFNEADIQLSVHAPYYTNFASKDAEKIEKTFGYVLESIRIANKMGAKRIVIHPGSLTKQDRKAAFDNAVKNFESLMEFLDDKLEKEIDYLLCIETLGKQGQIGTLDEVLAMVKPYEKATVCIDFGHVNSITQGSLKTANDYEKLILKTFEELGEGRAKSIHMHFSKIMYGESGEIRHLTFEDTEYGPEFEPLAEVIHKYKMNPVIICESKGTMAEDAKIIKELLQKND
ncbi:MAG: TIM barrel protein [Firmicutes bacterium]|nr:TIM barrel protein [Bacillota bacterium]